MTTKAEDVALLWWALSSSEYHLQEVVFLTQLRCGRVQSSGLMFKETSMPLSVYATPTSTEIKMAENLTVRPMRVSAFDGWDSAAESSRAGR